jgi:hypothetical protein
MRLNAPSGNNNLAFTPAVGVSSIFVTAAAYDTCDTTAPVTGVVTFDNTAGSAGALSSGAITSASGNLAVVSARRTHQAIRSTPMSTAPA